MNIIAAGRGTGKTTLLIRKSAELMMPILCYDHTKASSIKYKAERLGLIIPEPIIYNGRGTVNGKNLEGVLIDDLDTFLQRVIGTPIEYATTTSNLTEIYKPEHSKERLDV